MERQLGDLISSVRRLASLDGPALTQKVPPELSFGALALILAGNAFHRTEFHLSTELTPSPSYHQTHIFSRFLHLSFRVPGSDTYYKGRE